MRLSFCVGLTLLMFFTKSISIFGQDENAASTFFGAAATNADAWESGDVLVKLTSEFESLNADSNGEPIGVIIQKEQFIRIIFDYANRRFAQYYLAKDDVTHFDRADSIPAQKLTWNGAIVDFQSARSFTNDSTILRPRTTTEGLEKQFQMVGFRDYRALPILGERSGDMKLDYNRATERIINNWKSAKVVNREGNILELHLYTPMNQDFTNPETGDTNHFRGSVTINSFDKVSLMNIGSKHSMIFGKLLPVEHFHSENKIQWEERDGVFFPKTYTRKQNQLLEIQGKTESGTLTTKSEFHWFTTNKEISSDYFDGTHIQSRETIMNLVIPEKAGASTLIGQPHKADK